MTELISPIDTDPLKALQRAGDYAPYLARLFNDFGQTIGASGAERAFQSAVSQMENVPVSASIDDAMSALRRAKRLGHAALAALDLSGQADLNNVTEGLTLLAEMSVAAALRVALAHHNAEGDGLFLLALGKMGGRELNYSSDIDLVAFFDADLFNPDAKEQTRLAERVIRTVIQLLEQQTADGYVFRTDFRLRPDPRSTPIAIPIRRATNYYETLGQNWERMAWIKAAYVAGDRKACDHFLVEMQGFVWRQHLDYWAIADVHAIKGMINSQADRSGDEASADVKLGPGGIREIEFFVQTQQIILGGRVPALRTPRTLDGLDALVIEGAVPSKIRDELASAYGFLRAVEHRIQMLADEQTHRLPESDERRAGLAFLCGYKGFNDFLAALDQVRASVHQRYGELFAGEDRKRQTAIDGNLVFTGVETDPGTIETLTRLGFQEPEAVIEAIRNWHRGGIPATRTPRGRELLTALLPDALTAMAETGEADGAFRLFGRFLSGLASGVQPLSMLLSAPTLLQDLIATLALAPEIGVTLARNPSLMESLVSESVQRPAPNVSAEKDFETKLDLYRRWHAEESFLIGHRLLHGQLAARDAASVWSDLADQSIREMAAAAEAETELRFGPAKGKWIIVALGKLGGRELSAYSDLDILVIFDREHHSDAQNWFTRFTQRLITAISADTAAGRLYETDMRLRPSGRAGPVATSIEAFESYHRSEAWTWELMALTRFRVVAGDPDLAARAGSLVETFIAEPRAADSLDADILDMRRRLFKEKPPFGAWDLKQCEGGIVDLEFIVQHALLKARNAACWRASISDAVAALSDHGILSRDEACMLERGRAYLHALQQIQRLALGGETPEAPKSIGLKDRLARAVAQDGFSAVEAELEQVCGAIAALRCKRIGSLATDS